MAGPVDIFLSYAQEDDMLCAELERHLSVLQRDGVARIWSERRVVAGEHRTEAVEMQLAGAGIVLLLVSADYLASDYLYKVQAMTALARSRAGDARVIPVLLHACDWTIAAFEGLAPLPGNRVPVSTWPNRHEAWTAVVRGIRETIAGVAALSIAPEPAEARAADAVALVPPGVRRGPPSNLPPRRVFIGRKHELEALGEALRRERRTSIIQASLWGLGGVGKTALALEYAYRALESGMYPGGVWWTLAEGRPLDAMVQLAASLRQHAPSLLASVQPGAPAGELVDATRRALEAMCEPSLLVLDNVSEHGFVNLLPGGQVRVLLTTRDRRLALPAGKKAELGVLSSEDAQALANVRAGRPPAGEAEAAALARVVDQHLGGLAVAIEIAALAVEEWAAGWVAYERDLVERVNEALDAREDWNEHYPRGVFSALDMSIDRCGEQARRMLEGAAVFAPDAVPVAWACFAADAEPESIAAQRSLGELEGLGLAKVDREARVMLMSIHALVHKRARDRAEPDEWRGACARAVEYVPAWIHLVAGPAREQMEAVDALRPNIDAALVAAEQVEAASDWSLIASGLAMHLWHRAEYHEARSLLERALALEEKTFGPEHPRVSSSLSNLALLLKDLGDAVGARPLLERALAIAEKTFGPEHPNVAVCLSNLAAVLQELGDAAGARPLAERALAIDQKKFGPDDPTVAIRLSNLMSVLMDLGDAAGARPLAERALAIDQRTFGPEHSAVARSLSNLATTLMDLGDAVGARPLIEHALAINEQTFGFEHPHVAMSLSILAMVLMDLGDAAGARPLAERALAIDEKTFAPEHPRVARSLRNLALVSRDLGDAAGARSLAERALAIVEKTLGPGHPITVKVRRDLASLS